MGQKVNPHGLRVGVIKDWDSRWYAREDKVGDLIVEDYNIRKYLKKRLYDANISKIDIERTRKPDKSLFILDLAAPRNVDPQIGKRPNVFLYSVDDLEAACARNRELRDREIPKARKIIQEEATRYLTNIRARKSIEAIRRLREGWNDIKDAELERLFNKISCDPQLEGEIRYAFDRLVNKLLHSPTISLRNASQTESAPRLVEALKRLFRL